ncbi:MAG: hypothetical protein Q4F72_09645, partial [Desulfovibrionaceae bacterium]|nr:hypothetical protein [Desulfovibrionaceae bacterium]
DSVRPFMGKSKFEFRLFGRAYFGRKTEIELYGRELRGYVYVDLNRAARGAAAYERCAPEEVGEMGGFKRDWLSVRFGFFALVSTRDEQPGDMLASFLSALSLHAGLAEGGRGQLPDELWDAEAERGRILFSMLAESALGHVRRRMTDAGPLSAAAGGPAGDGRPDPAVLWERTQDLFCLDNGSGLALVDAPSPAAADCFALLGEKVPAALDLEAFRRKLGFR